jgi:hypothetical protein
MWRLKTILSFSTIIIITCRWRQEKAGGPGLVERLQTILPFSKIKIITCRWRKEKDGGPGICMEAADHSLLLLHNNYHLQMEAGKGWRAWPRCGGCNPFAPSPVCRLLQAASLSSLRNISLMNHVPCLRSSKRVPSFFAVVLFGTNIPSYPPPPHLCSGSLCAAHYLFFLSNNLPSVSLVPACLSPPTGEGEGEDGNGKVPMQGL